MDITLSVRDMFGVVAGSGYGCPKNILHWKGIQESILDLRATIPIHFVIADGIGPMEGNGPLNGPPRALGKIVLADDPVGADATCARPRTSATRALYDQVALVKGPIPRT
jgi:uncharacterized protein (DUF362 family)